MPCLPAVGAWGDSSPVRRVHERILRLQRKGDWPVRTSRILSQQEGSVVGNLRNLSGICVAVGVHLSAQHPVNDHGRYWVNDGGLHGSREHGSNYAYDRAMKVPDLEEVGAKWLSYFWGGTWKVLTYLIERIQTNKASRASTWRWVRWLCFGGKVCRQSLVNFEDVFRIRQMPKTSVFSGNFRWAVMSVYVRSYQIIHIIIDKLWAFRWLTE